MWSTVLLMALGAGGASEAAKPPTPYVDLQPIGFPVVLKGRLVNYVFADIRLVLAPGVDASRLQQQEPQLRDSLVRSAAHTPLNPPGDGLNLDQRRLQAEVMREAVARFGPGKVSAVVIRSATPQRRSGLPGVPPPVAPPTASPMGGS